MARRRVKITEFSSALAEILETYGYSVGEQTRQSIIQVAEIAKQEVRAGAPVLTGKYRRSWRVNVNLESRLRTETIIHSKNRYQLAHLLEDGHRLVKKGRQIGFVQAFPHIRKAEEHAIKNMEEAIKRIAQG